MTTVASDAGRSVGPLGHVARPHRRVRGTIRRRLLVNAAVDPDEASTRLPEGLRPHVTEVGTIVGCCLLDIADMQPASVPAALGLRLRATAHRISVDWEDASGVTVTGVYVPVRHTDSRFATVVGGRWFPGVHDPAAIDITASGGRLAWSSTPRRASADVAVRVSVTIPDDEAEVGCDAAGQTCLSASVGLSPGHRGALEAARMDPAHRDATSVVVEDLRSAFITSFASAVPAVSYLMRDVGVVWLPASSRLPIER